MKATQGAALERLPQDATLEQALAYPDAFQRIRRVAELLDTAQPSQLQAIIHAIESAPLPWGDLEYALFIEWWARFDPEEAVAYCQRELRVRHPRVISAALRAWGKLDPEAAIASGWLITPSMQSSGLNPDFVDSLVVGWFESGKPGLEDWLQSIDSAAKAAGLNAYMRMKVLKDGPRPTLEWALDAPYPVDIQRLMLATTLNIVARQDPKLAIEWLEIAEKRGVDVRTFTARIARGWSTFAPKEALEWVVTREQAQPLEFYRVLSDISATWLAKDEEGLHQWLLTQKDVKAAWTDLIRQQALSYYLESRDYRVDWLALMKRADEPVVEEMRQTLRMYLVQRWKLIDPDAANRWLDENKASLGDRIRFVDQVPSHEFHKIRKLFGLDKATKDKASAPTSIEPAAGNSENSKG